MARTELNYKSHSYFNFFFFPLFFNAVKELLFLVGFHRFTDWLWLGKKTSGMHLIQSPCSVRAI